MCARACVYALVPMHGSGQWTGLEGQEWLTAVATEPHQPLTAILHGLFCLATHWAKCCTCPSSDDAISTLARKGKGERLKALLKVTLLLRSRLGTKPKITDTPKPELFSAAFQELLHSGQLQTEVWTPARLFPMSRGGHTAELCPPLPCRWKSWYCHILLIP